MSTARVKRHSTSDLMDDWLDSQGFYRKHIAKDSSCLFRVVSEQLFNTQVRHNEVRNQCIEYMEKHSEKYSMMIDEPFENYMNTLRNPKEYGGQIEIMAMSSLFKCDFNVFQDVGKSSYKVTNSNYEKTILLCQSSGNHYDSVYPKTFIQTAAISQSIVYEILYKKVFALGDEVDFAVETMLHDKVYAKSRKDSTASVDSNSGLPIFDFNDSGDDKDPKETGSEIRQALSRGFPPFPYKVAKALDPDIYRNVEFDVWNESKKGEIIYEPGVKCLVRLDKDKPEAYHAHIQEMLTEENLVTVYIVELGKKQSVAIECLEPIPNNKCSPETFKGKKKLYKKNKFKDVQFSLPLSRGQSIPPRFQPQQQQPQNQPFGNGIAPNGRERELNIQAMNNSPTSFKWMMSSVTQNPRFRRNSDKFPVSQLSYPNQETHNYKISTGLPRPTEKFPVQATNSSSFVSNWAKTNGSMQSHKSSKSNSFDGDRSSESLPKISQVPINEGSSTSSLVLVPCNQVASVQPLNNTNGITTTQTQSSPVSSVTNSPAFTTQDNSSPLISSPQAVTIYPYQYFGVCLPYEPPLQQVNFGIPRSRDVHGSDLPLHDLATLRYFFNLGHDYFRAASIVPLPHQYSSTVWGYGQQMPYQTAGAYGTPANLGNENEAVRNSSPSNDARATTTEPASDTFLNEQKEFYEPAYMYDVSHLSLPSNAFLTPPQFDYTVPSPIVHPGIGEYKGGLILNEQGVLSLNGATPCLPTANAPNNNYQQNGRNSRMRSDSSSSSRSQRSNSTNWHKTPMKLNNNNGAGIINTNDSNHTNIPIYSSPKINNNSSPSNTHWQHRYQQRGSGSKAINNQHNNHSSHHQPLPPLIPVNHQQTYPILQSGSPILTAASPTSLGVYPGIGHGSPTTYYGSPPTTALLYSQPHLPPQPISYMASPGL